MDLFVYKDNKKLRYGYTTGSCAAAAAKGATMMLLGNQVVEEVELMTPKGIGLSLPLQDIQQGEGWVSCAVQKDSGDDPDSTNGILVYAKVSFGDGHEITLDGGVGVGRVTKPGLECAVGMAAINSVPRMMITREVQGVFDEYHFTKGLQVEISVPQGVEIAKRTFNPRLGIVGGISILGTSGIVEPMSEKALVDSIKVEMKMLAANGQEYLVVTPGNYGEAFAKIYTKLDISDSVKCSNYIGETLDYSVELGFKGILLIGHLGKFVKLAGGIMNTHSRYADCRMELLVTHAALEGAQKKDLERIMNCITTDDAIEVLDDIGIREAVLQRIMEKIHFYIQNRTYEEISFGVMVFSNKYGLLGQIGEVEKMIRAISN